MEKTENRCYLCGITGTNLEDFNYSFTELKNLAEALDLEVVGEMVQTLDKPNNHTYLGKGKIQELALDIEEKKADLLIINAELSPNLLVNIQDIIPCEVIDRTMLILRIFKERAQTKEAILQVEIARLKFLLPRLVGYHKNLSRQGGGGGGAGGARRGSGETALELDKRHIESKIYTLSEELAELTKARYVSRKKRMKSEIKTVSFVGYTNAGKSTTINNFLNHFSDNDEKKVFVKDMLFATLETSTRKITLENNHEFLITDTVGFVSHLPHHLIEAFKSTLEEITESSLIIHVIDSSSPFYEKQMETTKEVLNELGCSDIPILYLYNKYDLVNNKALFTINESPAIKYSNITGEGFDELIKFIEDTLFDDVLVELLIPFDKGNIYNIFKENANIVDTEYLNEGIYIKVHTPKSLYEKYKEYKK